MVSEPPGVEPSDEERLIFVSDASVEAERLTAGLRARGYTVIEVPLSLLVSRVAVQRPALVLCDVDAPGALEIVARLRDVPGAASIDIIFVGSPGQTLDAQADAVFHEGSGFFVRPVDVYSLLRKIDALIGPPSNEPIPGSQPMPARHSSAPPPPPIIVRSEPPARDDAPSLPAAFESPLASTHTSSAPPSPSSSNPPRLSSIPSARAPLSSSADYDPEPSLPAPVPLGFGAEPDAGPSPRQIPQSEMSPELERLLARAEQRLSSTPVPGSAPPAGRLSPEEEVEAVLPADVLAALDEPLDIEDDDDESDVEGFSGTRSGSESRTGTGGGTYSGAVGTSAGTVAGPLSTALQGVGAPPPSNARPDASWPGATTSAMQTTAPPTRSPVPNERSTEPPITPPPPAGSSGSSGPAAVTAVESLPERQAAQAMPRIYSAEEPLDPGLALQLGPRSPIEASRIAPPPIAEPLIQSMEPSPPPLPVMAPTAAPPPPAARAGVAIEIPSAIGPGDGLRALARSVRGRYTGAVAFEDPTGIRRIVLRDGDFVTASSGAQGESLIAFLAARGTLPGDAVTRLGHRLPPFGRHAGAALIAHGHLRQDELWPVLRAHAEWLVGHVIAMASGAASLERQVPPRLQAEPAVFGGATGAEVLIEVVRRVVPPDAAITALGGRQARLADGPAASLLGECALPEHEAGVVRRAKGTTLQEVLDAGGGDGFASALYALRELAVLEVLRPSHNHEPAAPPAYDQLDDEAIRERIRARRALVEEGDYFSLLGVSRSATGYDIRRAYLELRREFEPSRILTAATADLRDDSQLIVEVLDEAYEILREERRRERYRRALEAAPR